MDNKSNPMHDQIIGSTKVLNTFFEELESLARSILTTPEIYNIRRLIFIGSGDSFFAAKAAESSFINHSKLPVEVRPSLEGGQYHSVFLESRDLENTLVIALSNSGMTSRTYEAALMYKKAGARILGITQNDSSLLAEEAHNILILPKSNLPSAPNYFTFICSFLTLVLIGLRIGEVRMKETMDEVGDKRKELLGYIKDLSKVVKITDEKAHLIAEKCRDVKIFEFIGAGANLATADYGAAKILEAVGRHSLARDLEEWVHLNYFDGRPEDIATILLSPINCRCESRLFEIYNYMCKLRKILVVVGGGPLIDYVEKNDGTTLRCEFNIREIWSPLFLSTPIALLASHLSEIEGAIFGRGGIGPWEDSQEAKTVQNSKIMGLNS